LAAALIFDTDLDHFEQDVLAASQEVPVLVDFWAEWCPPCLVIAPVLEQVVKERNGEVRLAKLEVDEGERFSGAKPASFVEQFIDEHG